MKKWQKLLSNHQQPIATILVKMMKSLRLLKHLEQKEKQNSKQEQTTKPSQTQRPQKKKPVDSTKPGDRSDAKGSANPAGENPLKAKAETKTMNADSNSCVIKADERGNYRMEILDEQGKPFSLILPFFCN